MAPQAGESGQRVGTDGGAPPVLIVLGDAATLTRGGQGASVEDKRYQYG